MEICPQQRQCDEKEKFDNVRIITLVSIMSNGVTKEKTRARFGLKLMCGIWLKLGIIQPPKTLELIVVGSNRE